MKKESGDRIAKKYYTGVVKDDQLSETLYKAHVEYNAEDTGYNIRGHLAVSRHIPSDCTSGGTDHLDDKDV